MGQTQERLISSPVSLQDLLSLEWDEGHRSILSFLHILQMTQVTN